MLFLIPRYSFPSNRNRSCIELTIHPFRPLQHCHRALYPCSLLTYIQPVMWPWFSTIQTWWHAGRSHLPAGNHFILADMPTFLTGLGPTLPWQQKWTVFSYTPSAHPITLLYYNTHQPIHQLWSIWPSWAHVSWPIDNALMSQLSGTSTMVYIPECPGHANRASLISEHWWPFLGKLTNWSHHS